VIPIVEEVLVIEKRLVVREELRVKRVRSTQAVAEPVKLRTMQAVVERSDVSPHQGE
jgi:stress response protein YsnF